MLGLAVLEKSLKGYKIRIFFVRRSLYFLFIRVQHSRVKANSPMVLLSDNIVDLVFHKVILHYYLIVFNSLISYLHYSNGK